jgi:hypothetical protein
VIRQASRHARRDPQRFVDSGEIVMHGVDCDHSDVILDFLREGIGMPQNQWIVETETLPWLRRA